MILSEALKTAKGLCTDSRTVKPGDLFFCKGNNFKREYYISAVKNGAAAYVSESDYGDEIPKVIVPDIREAMADAAKEYYADPSGKLRLAGITGTKGKSTTLYFLKSIMEGSACCGEGKFGYVSTIDNYDGRVCEESHLTTPESIELNHLLSNMVNNGLCFAGMEVSSQGLKYKRVAGLRYEIGCFTNFSPDHIGPLEHDSIGDYFESKLSLIPLCKSFIVNLDDGRGEEVLAACIKAGIEKIFTVSSEGKTAGGCTSLCARNIRKENGFTVFELGDFGTLKLSMPGLFNVENAMTAAIIARCFGATNREIADGLFTAKAEGRMELTVSKDGRLVGIVDFAHNKLSFEKIFSSAKAEYPDRKIVAVFGCPGNKAPERRVELPRVAAEYADYVYITEDDPFLENPEDICREVFANFESFGGKGEIVVNREAAIAKAIENSTGKTVILFLAKGRDSYMHRRDYDPYEGDNVIVKRMIEAL